MPHLLLILNKNPELESEVIYPFTDWEEHFPNTSFPDNKEGLSFIDVPVIVGSTIEKVKHTRTVEDDEGHPVVEEWEEDVETPITELHSVFWVHEPREEDHPNYDPLTEQLVEESYRRDDDGVWYKVYKVEPKPTPKTHYNIYTGNAKLDLFTVEEQLAVVEATLTDPVVKLTYDRLINADFITYEDPSMELGLSLLVAKGLLTEFRKDKIVESMTTP